MANASQRKGLPCPKDAHQLLDDYFLEIRCHLLEAAAGFDRIERARGGREALKDPRMLSFFRALHEMEKPGGDRARRFLETFSGS